MVHIRVHGNACAPRRVVPPNPLEGDFPQRIDFTGPKGWEHDRAIVEYATERREGCFTRGGKGKFWEDAAQDLSKTAIFQKSEGEIGGKILFTRFKVLVAEAERLYGEKGTEHRVSGPGSTGVDSERERLLIELMAAKKEVDGSKLAVRRRTDEDRDESQEILPRPPGRQTS